MPISLLTFARCRKYVNTIVMVVKTARERTRARRSDCACFTSEGARPWVDVMGGVREVGIVTGVLRIAVLVG